MDLWQLGQRLGEIWAWLLVAVVVAYIATGRWRDYPDPEGRTAEQVATESRRRTRLVRLSALAIIGVWFVADTVISLWAVYGR
ncbi:hypothetical protein [Actinacidiphila yeochonensis]|uniref:hypothetical protein n=1 Tax=Actinacidiphila yeochonensis TaxID=89050 RepID=UPI000567092F|nr:hypothetical protein [Actinacidiphila yeochonensis]